MKFARYILIIALSALALTASETPYCLNFNGSNDYVMIDDDPLRFRTRFTLECWFNVHEFADSVSLIDYGSYNIREGYFFGYGISLRDSSTIAVQMGNTARSFDMTIGELKPDIWYHLAVTYDKFKNDENVVAFLNGKIIRKADCNISLEYPETFRPYGLVLGAMYDYPYIGSGKVELDDVRLWSTVRTNAEIKENIDRPIDPEAPGLVGYYTFDQEMDTIVADLSQNENHGRIYNMTNDTWKLSYAHIAAQQPSDVSFDRLVLPWSSSFNVASYCVDLSTDGDFTSSCDGFPVYNVSTNYLILDDIEPGTYYYRVKGHYEGEDLNDEPWSDIQSVSTVTDVATAIELSGFTLGLEGRSIKIEWETASQTENSMFILERRIENDDDWEVIHQIPGAGTNSEKLSYHVVDKQLEEKTAYQYRLKDVAYDGEISISDTLEIVTPEFTAYIDGLMAQPNPFNPRTVISFYLNKVTDVHIGIYDLSGRLIDEIGHETLPAGTHKFNWTPRGISSGIYLLSVKSDIFSRTHKLLYMK